MKKGDKFLIVGDHPHRDKIAEFVEWVKIGDGEAPKFKAQGGVTFFVFSYDNLQPVKKGGKI